LKKASKTQNWAPTIFKNRWLPKTINYCYDYTIIKHNLGIKIKQYIRMHYMFV